MNHHHPMPFRLAKKTVSYGIMHVCVAIAVAYALTRNWKAALAIGLIEPVFQTIAFVLHEKVWAAIDRKHANRPPPPSTS